MVKSCYIQQEITHSRHTIYIKKMHKKEETHNTYLIRYRIHNVEALPKIRNLIKSYILNSPE